MTRMFGFFDEEADFAAGVGFYFGAWASAPEKEEEETRIAMKVRRGRLRRVVMRVLSGRGRGRQRDSCSFSKNLRIFCVSVLNVKCIY